MVNVINALGKQELFSPQKVYNSLMRSGATSDIAKKITEKVEGKIRPNISTFEIYKIIKKDLIKEQKSSAIRFDLKYAIKKIGPDGFIFEKYIRGVFEELGFEVVNNQILKGKCISYEIDFIAKKDNIKYIGECKYRNSTGERIDVNVILKSFAVLDDLKNNNSFNNMEAMVVTNEKFTESAIKYAECKKIKLLGWRYPLNKGLESMIDENRAYPITILPSFNRNYLDFFAKENVLSIKNLSDEKISLLKKYKIKENYLKTLRDEANLLFD